MDFVNDSSRWLEVKKLLEENGFDVLSPPNHSASQWSSYGEYLGWMKANRSRATCHIQLGSSDVTCTITTDSSNGDGGSLNVKESPTEVTAVEESDFFQEEAATWTFPFPKGAEQATVRDELESLRRRLRLVYLDYQHDDDAIGSKLLTPALRKRFGRNWVVKSAETNPATSFDEETERTLERVKTCQVLLILMASRDYKTVEARQKYLSELWSKENGRDPQGAVVVWPGAEKLPENTETLGSLKVFDWSGDDEAAILSNADGQLEDLHAWLDARVRELIEVAEQG